MKLTLALSAIFLGMVATAASSQNVWHDEHGAPHQLTESAQSVDGFGGLMIVTADADWREKWETPSETIPSFSDGSTVEDGNTIYVLTFFSRPQLRNDGNADISCSLRLTRPDGSFSVDRPSTPCFQANIKTNPNNVYLTSAVIGFIAEKTDLRGQWTAAVTVTDNVRNVSVPLKASFTVK